MLMRRAGSSGAPFLMNVLGIESSCDETAAAVVRDGRDILANAVNSQVALHRPYGGVVPEIASRNHVSALPGLVDQAVSDSGVGWDGIDVVAVTYGPGLSSSLLVGLSSAKALAVRLGKPLVGINHLEAHIYSVLLEHSAEFAAGVFPILALIVSGAHTCIVRVERLGEYRLLGRTVDDAAGEAFDKGANLMGLGYPGGPAIDKIAQDGDPKFVRFPRGRQRQETSRFGELDADLCFSFSGVKTALLYYLRDNPLGDDGDLPSVAASYQEAIVDALVTRCGKALTDETHMAAVGGVSLNSRLRSCLTKLAAEKGVELLLPKPSHCGDNAAMVAGLAGVGQGVGPPESMALDATPNLPIGTVT